MKMIYVTGDDDFVYNRVQDYDDSKHHNFYIIDEEKLKELKA